MAEIFEKMIDQAPSVLALLAAAVAFAEVILAARRSALRKRGRRRRSLVLNWAVVIGSTLAALAFIIIIFRYWAPKDAWGLWHQQVFADFDRCARLNPPKAKTDDAKLDLKADCLALSLARHSLPADNIRRHTARTIAPDFSSTQDIDSILRDQRAGASLMSNETIGEVLRERYGIYSNLFLGSGYTLPPAARESSGPTYFRPGIREFLVRNYCVGRHEGCRDDGAHRDAPLAWGWAVDKDLTNDSKLTIGNIILTETPNLNPVGDLVRWKSYREQLRDHVENRRPSRYRILIRLAEFPPKYYKGTLAQPKRLYAFFNDARDIWPLSYGDASEQGGRILDTNLPADAKVFIWVVFLEPSSPTESGLASWSYVTQLLRQRAAGLDERRFRF